MLALTTLGFQEQIAFSGLQQNMEIPYASRASSPASQVFLSLASLMQTHEGSDFPALPYQTAFASQNKRFMVQESLGADRGFSVPGNSVQNRMARAAFLPHKIWPLS